MTVREVIKYIEQHGYIDDEVKDMAINAIKNRVLFDQIFWERCVAISQLEDIGLSLGEKTDKVKEAMEKQNAKKTIISGDSFIVERCPVCDTFVPTEGKHCLECGQRLEKERAWKKQLNE